MPCGQSLQRSKLSNAGYGMDTPLSQGHAIHSPCNGRVIPGRVLVFPYRTIAGQHKGHSSGGKDSCSNEFLDYVAMVFTVESLWSEDVYSG